MLDTRTPPVTVHQIVRYLADRYASDMKAARFWGAIDYCDYRDRLTASATCLAYYQEATVLRSVLRNLHDEHVATWRIGTKENKP